MNKEILLVLVARWVSDAEQPEYSAGLKGAEIPNAIRQGIREGKRECADGLRDIIRILG